MFPTNPQRHHPSAQEVTLSGFCIPKRHNEAASLSQLEASAALSDPDFSYIGPECTEISSCWSSNHPATWDKAGQGHTYHRPSQDSSWLARYPLEAGTSLHPSISPSTHPSTNQFIHPPLYPPTELSICPSIPPSTKPAILPPPHLPTNSSIHPFTHFCIRPLFSPASSTHLSTL
jgi:hypothetical protein